MKFFIKFGKEPKPHDLLLKSYIEMYNGKPRYIVTDKNMYSEGYIQSGRLGDYKRWQLKDINLSERIMVEVSRK